MSISNELQLECDLKDEADHFINNVQSLSSLSPSRQHLQSPLHNDGSLGNIVSKEEENNFEIISINNNSQEHDNNMNKYKSSVLFVQFVFTVLGIGTLLPWNLFVSAESYFNKRLSTCHDYDYDYNQYLNNNNDNNNNDNNNNSNDNNNNNDNDNDSFLLWFGLIYNISVVFTLALLLLVQKYQLRNTNTKSMSISNLNSMLQNKNKFTSSSIHSMDFSHASQDEHFDDSYYYNTYSSSSSQIHLHDHDASSLCTTPLKSQQQDFDLIQPLLLYNNHDNNNNDHDDNNYIHDANNTTNNLSTGTNLHHSKTKNKATTSTLPHQHDYQSNKQIHPSTSPNTSTSSSYLFYIILIPFIIFLLTITINTFLITLTADSIQTYTFQCITYTTAAICGASGAFASYGIVTFSNLFPNHDYALQPFILGQGLGGVVITLCNFILKIFITNTDFTTTTATDTTTTIGTITKRNVDYSGINNHYKQLHVLNSPSLSRVDESYWQQFCSNYNNFQPGINTTIINTSSITTNETNASITSTAKLLDLHVDTTSKSCPIYDTIDLDTFVYFVSGCIVLLLCILLFLVLYRHPISHHYRSSSYHHRHQDQPLRPLPIIDIKHSTPNTVIQDVQQSTFFGNDALWTFDWLDLEQHQKCFNCLSNTYKRNDSFDDNQEHEFDVDSNHIMLTRTLMSSDDASYQLKYLKVPPKHTFLFSCCKRFYSFLFGDVNVNSDKDSNHRKKSTKNTTMNNSPVSPPQPLSTTTFVWRRIKYNAYSIFLTFFITLTIFPAWITKIISVNQCKNVHDRFANDLFVPSLIVMFNISDFIGRMVAGKTNLRSVDDENDDTTMDCATAVPVPDSGMKYSRKITTLALVRLLFLPLFLLCNTGIASSESSNITSRSWIVDSDIYSVTLLISLAFTNGYVSTLSFIHAPSLIPSSDDMQSVVSTIMNFSVGLGLLAGSSSSFVYTTIGSHVGKT